MRSATVLFLAFTACSSTPASSSDASPGNDAAGNDAAPDSGVIVDSGSKVEANGVLIVGTLAAADLQTAQMQHDQIAMGGQPQAQAAGDIGHTVMLGTTLLGTKENEFLALDRWVEGSQLDAFYNNPQFVQAFSTLFSAPPSRVIYVKRSTWAGYGALDSAKSSDPYYWVVVRGTLTADDATAQKTHDQVVSGAKDQAMALGDVAHVVYTGRDDTKQFLAFDVWKDATNLVAFYSNPQLQQALATVIANPTIGIYHSTHFYQW